MKTLYRRAEHNFSYLRPHIVGKSVLDIGAAEGWTGEMIRSDDPGRQVQLLDVDDFNQTDLPLTVYDGQTIPFNDKSFDTSCLCLILHHCDDPDRVLSEAMRVTRKRLIITESVYHYKIGRALLYIADNIVNGLRTHSQMAKALHFRKSDEWERRFLEMGLAVQQRVWISRGFHKHILYVLERDKEQKI